MQFEVWEYECGIRYALCPAGENGERAAPDQDGGRCVLLIEADNWEEAKRKQNDFISEIRHKLMLSTQNLEALGTIDELKRLMQALAMLDAILCRDWEGRYFSFNKDWSTTEQMASLRNGQGDHWFAVFSAAGCWLKGFDHESPVGSLLSKMIIAPIHVVEPIPAVFGECLTEPAYLMDEITFCIWRQTADSKWHRLESKALPQVLQADGSAELLKYLDARPKTYCDWATDYYEREVPLEAVRKIYDHAPLQQELVTSLNPDVELEELTADAEEIGYPMI